VIPGVPEFARPTLGFVRARLRAKVAPLLALREAASPEERQESRRTAPCPGCGGAGVDVLGFACACCRGHGFFPAPCEACGELAEGRFCSAFCEAKEGERVRAARLRGRAAGEGGRAARGGGR
jgi:hypothetical protein